MGWKKVSYAPVTGFVQNPWLNDHTKHGMWLGRIFNDQFEMMDALNEQYSNAHGYLEYNTEDGTIRLTNDNGQFYSNGRGKPKDGKMQWYNRTTGHWIPTSATSRTTSTDKGKTGTAGTGGGGTTGGTTDRGIGRGTTRPTNNNNYNNMGAPRTDFNSAWNNAYNNVGYQRFFKALGATDAVSAQLKIKEYYDNNKLTGFNNWGSNWADGKWGKNSQAVFDIAYNHWADNGYKPITGTAATTPASTTQTKMTPNDVIASQSAWADRMVKNGNNNRTYATNLADRSVRRKNYGKVRAANFQRGDTNALMTSIYNNLSPQEQAAFNNMYKKEEGGWDTDSFTSDYGNNFGRHDYRNFAKRAAGYITTNANSIGYLDWQPNVSGNSLNVATPATRKLKGYTYNLQTGQKEAQYEKNGGVINKYQQGGQMEDSQMQQAFIQWLAQQLGVQSQEELESAIQQMGEDGLKQAYAQFVQLVQQAQVQAARFGAKLNYIKQLRGQCPDGYEMGYFKAGGRLCKKCMKKQVEAQPHGGPVSTGDAVQDFKNERKVRAGKRL